MLSRAAVLGTRRQVLTRSSRCRSDESIPDQHAGFIDPLHVIDDQRERTLNAQLVYQIDQEVYRREGATRAAEQGGASRRPRDELRRTRPPRIGRLRVDLKAFEHGTQRKALGQLATGRPTDCHRSGVEFTQPGDDEFGFADARLAVDPDRVPVSVDQVCHGRHQVGDLGLAADEDAGPRVRPDRARTGRGAGCAALRRFGLRPGDRPGVGQDLLVDLHELGAGPCPEFTGQCAPRLLEMIERVSLPAAPVQRDHE